MSLEITIDNASEKQTAFSDTALGVNLVISGGTTASFTVPSEDDFHRITPQLVCLDSMDGVEVSFVDEEGVKHEVETGEDEDDASEEEE